MNPAASKPEAASDGAPDPDAERPEAHWAMQLASREGGKTLTLVPSNTAVALLGAISLIGLALIGILFIPQVLLPIKIIAVVLGFVFLITAVLPTLRPTRCVFEKSDGVLRFGVGPKRNDRKMPLENIVAIETTRQIYRANPDAKPTDVFELHLLLANTRHMTLARHTTDVWITPAAHQLAEFLDVPLSGIDGADEDEAEKGENA